MQYRDDSNLNRKSLAYDLRRESIVLLFRFPMYVIAAPPYNTTDEGLNQLSPDSRIECAGDKDREYILVYSEEVFALNKLHSREEFSGSQVFEIRSKLALAELLDTLVDVHDIAGIAVDLISEEPCNLILYSRLRPMLHS